MTYLYALLRFSGGRGKSLFLGKGGVPLIQNGQDVLIHLLFVFAMDDDGTVKPHIHMFIGMHMTVVDMSAYRRGHKLIGKLLVNLYRDLCHIQGAVMGIADHRWSMDMNGVVILTVISQAYPDQIPFIGNNGRTRNRAMWIGLLLAAGDKDPYWKIYPCYVLGGLNGIHIIDNGLAAQFNAQLFCLIDGPLTPFCLDVNLIDYLCIIHPSFLLQFKVYMRNPFCRDLYLF